MPRYPLLKIAIFTGIPSCTMVAISCMFIWKPPSPEIAHTGSSGRASDGTHRGRHGEAHGAEPAGGEVGVGPAGTETASPPTSDAGPRRRRWCSVRRPPRDRAENPLGREVAPVAVRPRPHEARDLVAPGRAVARRHAAEQLAEQRPRIAHQPDRRGHVLPDLRRVQLDVNHRRAAGEGREVAGDPVVEPQTRRRGSGRPAGSRGSRAPRRASRACPDAARATRGTR